MKTVIYKELSEARTEAFRKVIEANNDYGFDNAVEFQFEEYMYAHSIINACIKVHAKNLTGTRLVNFMALVAKANEIAKEFKYNGYEIIY